MSIKLRKLTAAAAALCVAFMCAPAAEVSAEISGIVYGADAYTEKSDGLTVNISGHVLDNGSTAELKASSLPEEGLYVTYPISVPEDGEYSLVISANKYDTAQLSKYAVAVDGGEQTDIDADSVVLADIHPDGGNWAKYLGVFETNLSYTLSEGIHEITIHITSARSNGAVIAYFEYAKLVKDMEEEPDDGPAEDIYIYGSASYTAKSDAMIVNTTTHELKENENIGRFTGASLGDDGYLYITFPFTVKRDGAYALTVCAGRYDVGYLSKYAFSFDGGSDIQMNSSVISKTEAHPSGGNFATLMNVYTTNLELELIKGAHTATFKITGLRDQGNAYQFLEYFRLKFIDEDAMVREVEESIDAIGTVTEESGDAIAAARAAYNALKEELKARVSNYDVLTAAEKAYRRLTSSGTASIYIYGSDQYREKSASLRYSVVTDMFDNGKVVALRADTLPDDGLYITYSFDVVYEGRYTLYMSAPLYTNIYMSSYAIAVDGGKYKDIGAAVTQTMQTHPLGGNYAQYLGIYKTNMTYDLAEGEHTVSMKITGLRQNGDVYDFLEYFRFVLDEEIQSAEFAESVGYAEIGELYNAQIKAYGAVSESEIDISEADIKYSSSNTAAAEIAEDGTVTPKGFGSTVISADIEYKSFKDNLTMTLYVTADGLCCVADGYYNAAGEKISSLPASGGALSAKTQIYNNSAEDKTAVLILAVYDGNALVKSAEQEYSIAAGETADAQLSIDSLGSGADMSAKLYIWGDGNVPCPAGFLEYIK